MSKESVKVLKAHLEKLQKEREKQESRTNERAPILEIQEIRIQFGQLSKQKITREILNKMDVLAEKEKQLFKKSREICNRDTIKELDKLFEIENKIEEVKTDIFYMESRYQLRESYK